MAEGVPGSPDANATTEPGTDEPVTNELVIGARFQLGRFLGSGSTSAVFEALDLDNGDLVALKLQHPHLSSIEESRRRFLSEVEHYPATPHPNLVSVKAWGVHDGSGVLQAWIVIDHAPGISLAEWVELSGPLPVPDAIVVAAAVLAGLTAVHGDGLVHHDISPNNVMVKATRGDRLAPDDVRIIDFGLAVRPLDAATVAPLPGDLIAGSVSYISPERARGLAVDARGDLYSVACVLYFCLTGQPPFLRASSELTLRAHVNSPPPLPSALRSEVSRELDRFVARGLAKRPEGRFSSAESMRTELPPHGGGAAMLDRVPEAPDARTTVMLASPLRTMVLSPREAATERFAATSPRTRIRSRPPQPTAQHRIRSTGRSPKGLVIAVIVTASIVVTWGSLAALSQPTPQPTAPIVAVAPGTAEPVQAAVVPPTEAQGVTLFDISSLPLREATERLTNAGLAIGDVTSLDSARPLGTVLSTSPEAGAWVTLGASVALTVASGSNAVPPVEGLTRDAAVVTLQAAGFAVRTATVEDPIAMTGAILGSQPAGGASAPLGSIVTVLVAFTVANPPTHSTAPVAPDIPVTPTPTPMPTPQRFADGSPAASIF